MHLQNKRRNEMIRETESNKQKKPHTHATTNVYKKCIKFLSIHEKQVRTFLWQ